MTALGRKRGVVEGLLIVNESVSRGLVRDGLGDATSLEQGGQLLHQASVEGHREIGASPPRTQPPSCAG